MKLLKKITTPISLDNMAKLSPNENYSAITFDDGFRNVKENALPILEKHNLHATIFCLASDFGEKPKYDYDPITRDKFEDMMTIEEIKSLPLKNICIGSHSISHAKLNSVKLDLAEYELLESKNILESILSRDVQLFSFPNGEYNQDVIDAAFKFGYEKVFTIDPELAYQNEKVLGRFSVEPSDWLIEFRLKILGYYRWQMIVKKIKAKIR